jgi:hypothetical protein
MPKSKKRGGEKSHRKKISLRNTTVKSEIKKQQKMFQDAMLEQLEAYKEKMSGETKSETTESIKLNTDGFVQSSEIL